MGDRRLQPEDPLYPLSESAIEKYFARRAKKFIGPYKGHNPCRPHSLRAGFYTLGKDNKADPEYIEFWMGHEVPEQKKVYMSKGRDGWRKAYAEQAEPALTPLGYKPTHSFP
jgi:integrase